MSSRSDRYYKLKATQPPLQHHLNAVLNTTDPAQIIASIATLVPDLKTRISNTGERLVTHPNYTGNANLSQLATIYLRSSLTRCRDDLSLSSRLQWDDVHSHFEKFYVETNRQLGETWIAHLCSGFREFSIGCPCCAGKPSYVLPDGSRTPDVFCFSGTDFERFWPGQKDVLVSGYPYIRSRKVGVNKYRATREMVLEAAGREKQSFAQGGREQI